MNLTLLKDYFARFIRTRAISRHFQRLAMLESFSGTGVSRDVPPSLAQKLSSAAKSDIDTLLKQLASHADGLSKSQADSVRERVGLNEIEQEKPLSWWQHLWRC